MQLPDFLRIVFGRFQYRDEIDSNNRKLLSLHMFVVSIILGDSLHFLILLEEAVFLNREGEAVYPRLPALLHSRYDDCLYVRPDICNCKN